MSVIHCVYVGGLTGFVKRKGRGKPTMIVSSLIAGLAFGAATVGMLMVLTRLRHLILQVTTANVNGMANFLTRLHQQGASDDLKRYFAEGLHYWQWLMLAYYAFGIMTVSLVGWWALSRLLERMRGIPDVHKLDAWDASGGQEDPEGPAGPVPVRLDKVRFRYPGTGQDALREITLDVGVGEQVAVTGANGSGKTTLMLILAGRKPTSGTVERPGAVGLGKLGGTAVVLQHPESQVLGSRVADDVVWGCLLYTSPPAGRAGGTHQHARQHRHDRGHRTDRCRRDPSRREPGSQLPSQRGDRLGPYLSLIHIWRSARHRSLIPRVTAFARSVDRYRCSTYQALSSSITDNAYRSQTIPSSSRASSFSHASIPATKASSTIRSMCALSLIHI